MTKLSNDILREKSMQSFLFAMGIDTTDIKISSIEGLYGFNCIEANQAERFANQLNDTVRPEGSVQQVKQITLAEIIDEQINSADCEDKELLDIHKKACKAVLDIVKSRKTEFEFSQESGLVEVKLPSPMYAGLLNVLNYPHMEFTTEGKLVIDFKKFIKDTPESVLKLEGLNASQPPLVFLNAKALESKQIFFATKVLPKEEDEEDEVETTPYYFVPEAIVPPVYHFVLDVSGSMRDDIQKLKETVSKLMSDLLEYQPKAKISVTTFASFTNKEGKYEDAIRLVGEYQKDSLNTLAEDLSKVVADGHTPLYQVSANFIDLLNKSHEHQNVLLFTDGHDESFGVSSAERLDSLLTALGTEPTDATIRNKFCIFSYREAPGELMSRICSTFRSELTYVKGDEFEAALSNPALLKKWASARDLHNAYVVIEDKVGLMKSSSYRVPVELSGQLVSLEARVCKPGEKISISVTDGRGKEVVNNTKQIPVIETVDHSRMRGTFFGSSSTPQAPASNPSYTNQGANGFPSSATSSTFRTLG